MKKLLPIAAIAALAMPAHALQSNYEYADFAAYAVSPNGRYVLCQLDGGVLIIRDMETNTQEIYTPDPNNENATYSTGNGNCISDDGMAVGSTESGPCFFLNGEVLPLPIKSTGFISLAHGVTPDGSVICGTMGLNGMSMDSDSQMSAPCIWVRDEEGNYQGPLELPYPDRDFSGRIPQYVTTVAISNDGKTIAGQIRDYSGWVEQPIVYTCDDEGEWHYSLIAEDLINPNHVEFPEYPGDGPMMPSAESYLGADEKAAFEQAIADWQAACNESGYYDYNTYPEAEDYLSAGQKEEYDKAMEEFADEYPVWEAAFFKFMAAFEDCVTNGQQFIFNSVFLSPDGKRYLTTADAKNTPEGAGDVPVAPYKGVVKRAEGESSPASLYLFELDNDNAWSVLSADGNLLATGISSDYTVFGCYDYSILPRAYVFNPGQTEGMMLEKWFETVNPATAEWMEDNMVFDVLAWDMDLMQEITIPDVMCSGYPRIDQDVTIVACNTINLWDYSDASYYYTFFLTTGRTNGVASVATDNGLAITLEGNVVKVSGDVAETSVYAIDGTLAGKGTSEVTLSEGIYVVRATASDGTVKILKTAVR